MAAFLQPGPTQLQLQRDCPVAALAPGGPTENARPSVTLSGQGVRRRCGCIPLLRCDAGLAAAPAAPTVTSSQRSFTATTAVATGSSAAAEAAAEDGADANAAVATLPFRVGHGFDLHRLEPNLPLIIGGVNIPHDRGCEAHSDGDVLMHCVVDAILGALGLPDIGQLFPDNDPKWKGAPSHVFVTEAVRRMEEAGYSIGNLDSTIILQRPKLSPHKAAIKENLCKLLHASPAAINVKAKTHEKVDSLGENRSVACHTVVLLIRRQE